MTDYQVVRSRRRTMALQVDQSGAVVVRAPMTLPAEEIRTFVEKHETWIHRQQQRQARYRAEHPEPTPQEQEALRRQAKAHLPQRVAYWAGVMGVRPTGIKITSARTRFGSCSGNNSLCFSLYLMAYPRRPSSMWWSMSWPISAIKTTVPPSTPRWSATCRTGGSGRPC